MAARSVTKQPSPWHDADKHIWQLALQTWAVGPSNIGSWPFKNRQLALQTGAVGPPNLGCLPALQADCACCTSRKGDWYVLQETSAQRRISLNHQRHSPCLSASCHNKLAVLTERGTCMCMLTMPVVPSGKCTHADCVLCACRKGDLYVHADYVWFTFRKVCAH